MNFLKRFFPFSAFLLAFAVLAAALGLWLGFFWPSSPNAFDPQSLLRFLKNPTGELQAQFDAAAAKEKDLQAHPDDLEKYAAAVIAWKGLGDVTGERIFYERAVDVIHTQFDLPNGKSAIAYMNLGVLFRLTEEWEKGEDAYQKALELSPGDELLYISFADFYKAHPEGKSEQALAVYAKGLATIAQNKYNLTVEYASFLRFLGRVQGALELYQGLHEAFPESLGFVEKIEELEAKLGLP